MSAIEAMRFLSGASALLFVTEEWFLREHLRAGRARDWKIIRRDFKTARAIFDVVFSEVGMTLTLAARAVAALGLLIAPHAIDALTLIVGQWLWSVRWRGKFNGGSDTMNLVVLSGLLIWLLNPAWERVALIYVAAHLMTSYIVSGLAKFRNREWRSGAATRLIAADTAVARLPKCVLALGGWAVIAFENSFPVSLYAPWPFVVTGLFFHLSIVYILGLNRFAWSWLAAYPALIALGTT